MPPVWFERKKDKADFIGFAKPVAWQGWAVHLGTIFVFALLAQMLGRWAFVDGLKPLGLGVWLFAGVFLLLGLYFRAISYFSGKRG